MEGLGNLIEPLQPNDLVLKQIIGDGQFADFGLRFFTLGLTGIGAFLRTRLATGKKSVTPSAGQAVEIIDVSEHKPRRIPPVAPHRSQDRPRRSHSLARIF